MVKRIPLTPPNVESATKTGITHDMKPYIRSANVCNIQPTIDAIGAITCVLPEGAALVASGVPNQVQAGTGDVHNPHTSVPRLPDRFCTPQQMIWHAIGSARRPAPTTLFHVWGRNLATELSLWPGQSCGTVCQRQFVMRTVYTLLNADSNRTFLACVLMIDSVMPFRSGFAHGGH